MSYEIQVQPTLLRVTLHGSVTSKELLQFSQEVARLEAASGVSRNLLTELKAIEAWNLSPEEMQGYAAARSRTSLKNRVKSAIVAIRDVDFGMARMFGLMIQNPNIEVMVFRDMPSARQWLDAGPPAKQRKA